MRTTQQLIPLLALCLVAGACQPMPGSLAPGGLKVKVRSGDGEKPRELKGEPTPQPTAAPAAPVAPAVPPRGTYFGQVLGLDGQPAVGVLVRGHVLSNNGGSLIGKVKSPAGLISNNGGNLIGKVKTPEGYRVLSTALETQTDAEGRFKLTSPDGLPLNLEAVKSDEVKAIAFGVPEDATGVTLQLAPTGNLTGQVTAPEAPTVTDFEGTDVFVPGTSYMAKADKSGRFTITNMPAGIFELVASKRALGTARAEDVEIKPKETTTAPALALSVAGPRISSLGPENGGPGTTVTITGEHFGASLGETIQVSIGGVLASTVDRVDDQTIKAVVPDGAPSGDVVVNVGGIQSAPVAFRVIRSIELLPATATLLLGKAEKFTALAKDAAGQAIAGPSVTWSVEGSAFTVDALGSVTPSAIGSGKLVVSSGSVKKSHSLAVAKVIADVKTTRALVDPGGVAMDASARVHYTDRSFGYYVVRVEADGKTTTVGGGSSSSFFGETTFNKPLGLAVAADGTVYVADTEYHRIRQIAPDGTISTLTGSYTKSTISDFLFGGFTNGTLSEAKFRSPTDLALSADGKVLFVADRGNHAIRKVDMEAGLVSTLAGSGSSGLTNDTGTAAAFDNPTGLGLDKQGNVYVADRDNHRIRKITPEGVVTTVAGASTAGGLFGGFKDGPAAEAEFSAPSDVAVDDQGVLYVSDGFNHRIRMIGADGVVSTLAGNGLSGADEVIVDGQGTLAFVNEPRNLVVNGAGSTLYVADETRVRKITLQRAE